MTGWLTCYDPASDERDDALRRLLAAEPVSVPADPGDLKAEVAEARDRLA